MSDELNITAILRSNKMDEKKRKEMDDDSWATSEFFLFFPFLLETK